MGQFFLVILLVFLFFLSGCSSKSKSSYGYYEEPRSYSEDQDAYNTTVSKKDYHHPTMKPYEIRGIKYYPTLVQVGDIFHGNASWYGPDFHGKATSNGESYNMYAMTAAHKTLPMNTVVKVTNKKNGKSTIVRVNDRGPFVATRIIDLSNTAARAIDMVGDGTAPVKVEVLGFHSKEKLDRPLLEDLQTTPQDQRIDGFALQIGSFARFEGAVATQKKYNNTDGYTTIIKDVQTNDGRLFRVWLKGFRSEQEARDYVALGHFKGSFVVRED